MTGTSIPDFSCAVLIIPTSSWFNGMPFEMPCSERRHWFVTYLSYSIKTDLRSGNLHCGSLLTAQSRLTVLVLASAVTVNPPICNVFCCMLVLRVPSCYSDRNPMDLSICRMEPQSPFCPLSVPLRGVAVTVDWHRTPSLSSDGLRCALLQ